MNSNNWQEIANPTLEEKPKLDILLMHTIIDKKEISYAIFFS